MVTLPRLLASCDAVLTTPGYGTFTETAVNGIPVLYVRRKDWPEQSYLIAWLEQHGHCREVRAEQLACGTIANDLQELPLPGSYPAVKTEGVRMAVDAIASMLPSLKG